MIRRGFRRTARADLALWVTLRLFDADKGGCDAGGHGTICGVKFQQGAQPVAIPRPVQHFAVGENSAVHRRRVCFDIKIRRVIISAAAKWRG